MTVLEHCHRVGCSQVVGALKQRIAELEEQQSELAIIAHLDAKKESAKRIAELEAALDVALEWFDAYTSGSMSRNNAEQLAHEALVKLKEVRSATSTSS